MTQRKRHIEHEVKMDVEARVRQGVKAVLEKEMTQHIGAGYRELTPTPGEESATDTTSATY